MVSQASSSVRLVRKGGEKWNKTESRGQCNKHSMVSGRHGNCTLARSTTIPNLERYVKDVPAPTCLRDKTSCPPGTICRGGVWWKTPNAGSVAGPRHCITWSAIARMPLPMVGTHGDITRSFEKWVRQKQQLPKQTRARKQTSERFIFARRFLTPLRKEMSNAEKRYSCRYRRSRYRRDEALAPAAEAGHGVAVDGWHHSGGTDGLGGQIWV